MPSSRSRPPAAPAAPSQESPAPLASLPLGPVAHLSPVPPMPHPTGLSPYKFRPTIPLPSLHPSSGNGREEPAAWAHSLLSPRAREERSAAIPGMPPSAQRPGCPGTPSSSEMACVSPPPWLGPRACLLVLIPGPAPSLLPAAATAVCFLRCVSFFPLLGSIKRLQCMKYEAVSSPNPWLLKAESMDLYTVPEVINKCLFVQEAFSPRVLASSPVVILGVLGVRPPALPVSMCARRSVPIWFQSWLWIHKPTPPILSASRILHSINKTPGSLSFVIQGYNSSCLLKENQTQYQYGFQ